MRHKTRNLRHGIGDAHFCKEIYLFPTETLDQFLFEVSIVEETLNTTDPLYIYIYEKNRSLFNLDLFEVFVGMVTTTYKPL